jgi:hypothetical protein
MTAGDVKITSGAHDYLSGVVANGADDYLQIDAVATYEAGANNTKGTISAWVNIPDITNTYCIFAAGVNAAVSYYQFSIKAGKLNFVGASAGGGGTICDVVATTATLTPHKWHLCTVVQDGVRPTLYLDGVAIAMTDTTATDLTVWGNTLATWDKGAIGILNMNATTTLDFKGGLSYVKYSTGTTSAALWTPAQVLAEYQYKAGRGGTSSGTASSLCTWTLNGTLLDSQTGGGTYTATIVSDVQYDSEYSELTSKLRLLAPVVADDLCLVGTGGTGVIAVRVTNA